MTAKVDISSLSKEYLCEMVKKIGFDSISIDHIEKDIAAGLATNSDGTVNLLNYIAWILAQEKDGRHQSK
jgi:hypothetical protein